MITQSIVTKGNAAYICNRFLCCIYNGCSICTYQVQQRFFRGKLMPLMGWLRLSSLRLSHLTMRKCTFVGLCSNSVKWPRCQRLKATVPICWLSLLRFVLFSFWWRNQLLSLCLFELIMRMIEGVICRRACQIYLRSVLFLVRLPAFGVWLSVQYRLNRPLSYIQPSFLTQNNPTLNVSL